MDGAGPTIRASSDACGLVACYPTWFVHGDSSDNGSWKMLQGLHNPELLVLDCLEELII